MQLVCNELSFLPLAENSHIAEARFINFLQTFREAKQKYSFSHIRFPVNYASQKITVTQTFFEWISAISNSTLKNLVLDLCKAPFTDELDYIELETFFKSNYVIPDETVPTKESPIGLPVAFIKSMPSISFDSHTFWQKRKIELNKTNGNEFENSTFYTYNICIPTDIHSKELLEWADSCIPQLIDTIELLEKYLSYTKYTTVFTDNFMNQFFEWKASDKELYQYLLLLMKDVELHPFTGGMGQTENLKHRGKEASKRVTQPDRLSYSIENNIVTFIACKGHYEFHN